MTRPADPLGTGRDGRARPGPAELGQPLAAAAARRDQLRVGHDGDLGDPASAARHERADRRRLGALALRVGGVLDVARRRAGRRPRRAARRRPGISSTARRRDPSRCGRGRRGARSPRPPRAASPRSPPRPSRSPAMPRTSRSSATFACSAARSESGGATASSSTQCPRPVDVVEVDAHVAPQQQAAPLDDLDRDAERRVERGGRRLRIGDVGEVVGGQPRLAARRRAGSR